MRRNLGEYRENAARPAGPQRGGFIIAGRVEQLPAQSAREIGHRRPGEL